LAIATSILAIYQIVKDTLPEDLQLLKVVFIFSLAFLFIFLIFLLIKVFVFK